MSLIRYLILILFLWNIPSYLLAYFSPVLGSISSYASSILLFIYYLFTKDKHKLVTPFIFLGLLYYLISSLNFSGEFAMDLIKEFARFMLVVICGVEVLHRTTKKDIYLILLIGALSIVINALVFPTANANFYANYGRFSGFYLNPNFAGSICLVGYALSYVMTNKILRLSGQILFTLGGILTLSRTFFVIWLLVNIVAVYKDRKNFIAPIFGALVLVMILTFSAGLTLNTERFTALKSIFGSENIKTKTIAKDSRTDTWSLYTDMILDKPFFGNGYQKFQLRQSGLPGVHNSYLMVLGEAGIIPFLFITGIYLYILIKSYKIFAASPELFYVSLVVAIALLTGHGYFSNYYNVMISMYVFIQLRLTSEPIQVPQKKPLSEFFLEN